jgi:hypothetical protein
MPQRAPRSRCAHTNALLSLPLPAGWVRYDVIVEFQPVWIPLAGRRAARRSHSPSEECRAQSFPITLEYLPWLAARWERSGRRYHPICVRQPLQTKHVGRSEPSCRWTARSDTWRCSMLQSIASCEGATSFTSRLKASLLAV